MKFLIDEDLSPKVAERLRLENGVDAIHVRDRGLLGRPDPVIMQKAYEEDRILVTANVKDFQRLARSCELHPGIVLVLDGALSRDEQLALLHKAIEELEQKLLEGRDLVNRVLEIEANGRCNFYDLSLHSEND